MFKFSKGVSLVFVLLVYCIAFVVSFLLYKPVLTWTGNVILTFFILDVVATIIVWASGLIFKNASLYDPYWSVVPIIMIAFFAVVGASTTALSNIAIMYIVVLAIWGLRLTVNWIVDWPGMKHQDWRYTLIRDKNPKMYLVNNFIGINMMPTLFVFAAMVPAFYALSAAASVNAWTFVGAAICVIAAVLQFVSDGQMRRFRKGDNSGKNMDKGLWSISRHPNYFGEVSLWWGIWIMQISVLPSLWLTILGPAAMTVLFVFISIPMMKNKLLDSKEGYEEYVRTTSMLIPWAKKK